MNRSEKKSLCKGKQHGGISVFLSFSGREAPTGRMEI